MQLMIASEMLASVLPGSVPLRGVRESHLASQHLISSVEAVVVWGSMVVRSQQ
jgi:hypothetical protein